MNTIVDQLGSASKTWKSYAESMDAYDGPDLASVKTTPSFSLIGANGCNRDFAVHQTRYGFINAL